MFLLGHGNDDFAILLFYCNRMLTCGQHVISLVGKCVNLNWNPCDVDVVF